MPCLLRRGAGLVDPAQAGSTVLEGRQAERGGGWALRRSLEASEARSAAGAKVREGLTPNGRDGKDGTGRSPKARRRCAPTRANNHDIQPKTGISATGELLGAKV